MTSVWDYDVNDRLRSIRHAGQVGGLAGYLLDLEYDYSPSGVRLYTANNLTPGRSELYTHDPRQRLRGFDRGTLNTARTAIATPLNDAVLPSEQNWSDLDRRGNWLAFDETLNGTTTPQTRTRNGVNEYLTLDPDAGGSASPVSFTNDAAGNLTVNPLARNIGDGSGGIPSPSGQTYEYDEENRLKAVKRGSDLATLLSMKYDALGRRVESTDHTAASDPCDGTYQPVRTRHVAAGIETLAEFIECPTGSPPATAWVKAREFVWGAAFPEPLAMIDWTEAGAAASGTAEVLHYVHQHLGSPAALTNASREAVERYTYDPYGRTTIENAAGTRLAASAFGNPFAWTGQRYDAGVKLYHFLFRSYSPEIGRWMQRDPLGYVNGANLLQYCASAALTFLDPFGLNAIIRVHVDNGDEDPGSYGWGHVWITITTADQKVCVGFWPTVSVNWLYALLGLEYFGMFQDDTANGHSQTGNFRLWVSDEQGEAAIQAIRHIQAINPNWSLDFNCTSFVLAILEAAGITFPKGVVQWGGWDDPGKFEEAMRLFEQEMAATEEARKAIEKANHDWEVVFGEENGHVEDDHYIDTQNGGCNSPSRGKFD